MSTRALLFWGAEDSGVEALRELLREDPALVLASLGDEGAMPTAPIEADQVVILADWTLLSGDLSVLGRWRDALFPVPVAVLVRVERGRLVDELVEMIPGAVDDVVEVPCPPAYLPRKVLMMFRYVTAQQGTRGLRAELAEQVADFEEFHRVALALAAESNVDRLLELIVEKCREVTAADAGSLYLVEERPPETGDTPGPVLRFTVAQNDSVKLDLTRVTLPLDRSTIAGYVALTRTPLNVPDVYRLPPTVDFAFNPLMDQRLGYRTVSMLAMPLVDPADQVVGVVQLINKKRGPEVRLGGPAVAIEEILAFDADDEGMVRSLASLAAVVAVKGRRAEQARLALERQLQEAQKMEAVGRLASGVAHDFNHLVTVIAGHSALLLDRVAPDDPLRRHLRFIEQAARRATDLTRQLQTFSQEALGEPPATDLNVLLRRTAPALRELLGEGIALDLVEGATPGRVKVDPRQLEVVVISLATNAREAMPHGGRLTIQTADADLPDASAPAGARPGPHVRLVLRDTGSGMTEDVRAHLFDPFFTTKGPDHGGLGLATVWGIVQQHAGSIDIQSQPGCGTTVTIDLPRSGTEGEAAAGAAAAPAPGHAIILVVDDDDGVRELVREILAMRGYTVLQARHGPEALSVSERHPDPIHLLLTDMVMPEMSGRALADQLVRRHPAIRVLYMSGYASDAVQTHGGLTPGSGLVRKPFTPDDLVSAVVEALADPPAA